MWPGFLKKNPEIVFWTFFGMGGHSDYVVSEFSLGKALRCDFVLMSSDSGGWEVNFVELEPVHDSLYNKDRTPSRRLRIAKKQIDDWKRYVHDDGISLRMQLAEAAKSKNCLYPKLDDHSEPSSLSGKLLCHPKTHIQFYYHIVIGRREKLSPIANELRSSSFEHDRIEIATYDRFIETLGKMRKSSE